jgi:hypothetical protein
MIGDRERPSFIVPTVERRRYSDGAFVTDDPEPNLRWATQLRSIFAVQPSTATKISYHAKAGTYQGSPYALEA